MVKRGMTPQQAARLREKMGVKMTKLQRLRVQKGYSQSELAEISGVPFRRIQHYEQQSRPIDSAKLEVICKLCVALDCKIEDIIENEEVVELLKQTR